MVTKEEKSDELNNILGTDIEWDRMLEEDLDEFLELTKSGELLNREGRYVVKEYGKEELESIVDSWSPGQLISRLI